MKYRVYIILFFTFCLLSLVGCEEREGEGSAVVSEKMYRQPTPTEQYNDSILQSNIHLDAILFHTRALQLEMEQQKKYKLYAALVACLIGILAIMGLFFAWYAASRWRKTRLKNRVLAQHLKDSIIYKEKYEELRSYLEELHVSPNDTLERNVKPMDNHSLGVKDKGVKDLDSLSPEELFRYIEHEVSRRLLFLNPLFDRKMIMEEFHLSKERVGAAFSQGSKYDSLPQFVSDLRLEYASKLLVTTDLSISEIMSKAGFSNASVFSRYFSRKYQISPTQYRRFNSNP